MRRNIAKTKKDKKNMSQTTHQPSPKTMHVCSDSRMSLQILGSLKTAQTMMRNRNVEKSPQTVPHVPFRVSRL